MTVTYESYDLAPGLEELVAVARCQHVTRAAEQLGIAQPTLSRNLARLSSRLGTPLLRREGRGVRLTRHGRLLADYAERALEELLVGVRAVRAEADPDTGTVSLGFLHSMGPSTVPALLRGFRLDHPGVTVELFQGGAEELIHAVMSGRVDLSVTSIRPGEDRPVSRDELTEQPIVLLAPGDHRLAGRPELALGEAIREPLITMAPGYGLRTLTDSLLVTAGVTARYLYECQELSTAIGLVAAGLGVALVPAGSGVPGTVELSVTEPGVTRTIALVRPNDRPLSAPADRLRRHIAEHAPDLLRRTARTASEGSSGPAAPR
jgi:DNA-binding transcriptional LysR family regulator